MPCDIGNRTQATANIIDNITHSEAQCGNDSGRQVELIWYTEVQMWRAYLFSASPMRKSYSNEVDSHAIEHMNKHTGVLLA